MPIPQVAMRRAFPCIPQWCGTSRNLLLLRGGQDTNHFEHLPTARPRHRCHRPRVVIKENGPGPNPGSLLTNYGTRSAPPLHFNISFCECKTGGYLPVVRRIVVSVKDENT